MLGRVQIESDNIFQLIREVRIVADLEAVNAVGLEAVASPDAAHRRIGDALGDSGSLIIDGKIDLPSGKNCASRPRV